MHEISRFFVASDPRFHRIDLGFQVLSKAIYLSTYYNLLYRLLLIHIADALVPQRLHFDFAMFFSDILLIHFHFGMNVP